MIGGRSIQVFKEEYENLHGGLYPLRARPLQGVEVELCAPDGEVFRGYSDSASKFSAGPLPAFPYVPRIPGFLFTSKVNVCTDAIIGGKIIDERGVVLSNKILILKQDGKEIGQQTTDRNGNFRFDIAGGRYTIEIPEYNLYARTVLGGSIKGKLTGVSSSLEIELIVQERTVSASRISPDGTFRFQELVPGSYTLRLLELMLRVREIQS